MLFNMFRRLVLGAYCVVNRGIPAHNEGMLDGSRNFTDRVSFTMANYCRASANEQNLKIPTLVQLSECDYASGGMGLTATRVIPSNLWASWASVPFVHVSTASPQTRCFGSFSDTRQEGLASSVRDPARQFSPPPLLLRQTRSPRRSMGWQSC